MERELLSQLRDIHLPEAPQWWPPAPGWWLLAAMALGLLTWGAVRLWWRWRRFRPARAARHLHRRLTLDLHDGSITPTAWLHRTNEALKRLAIRGLGHCEMIPAWGDDWLRYLDGRYGEPAFSEGAGRCLGQARFQPGIEVDVQALDDLVSRLLNRECRRFWRFAPMLRAPVPLSHAAKQPAGEPQ